ncbi:MAG: ECF transporter S component [Clostridia bacterium]|nr:ECF transporter S component [Clostridia bacterium]
MRNKTNVNFIVKVGMLSAVAFVLQMLGRLFPHVGGFLEIEFSDLPALIGAFALGPMAGVLIELIKNILHCFFTTTGCIGELANFLVNGSMVLVAGLLYKRNKSRKGALISMLAGVAVMVISAFFSNFLLLIPLYMPTAPLQAKLDIVLSLITPFNFVKGVVISFVTFFIYKPLSRCIK